VTQKGQGHDPDIKNVHCLENGWRFTYNRASIGNGTGGIKWERDQ